MNEYVIKSIIELVFTVLAAVITTVLLPALASWLKSKTDNENIKAVISDITTTVATCVDHCEQTTVAALKANGTWDKEAQADVLRTVINNVTDSLLTTTKTIIDKNGIDLEEIITQHIEAYIQSKKGVAKNETLTLEEISH